MSSLKIRILLGLLAANLYVLTTALPGRSQTVKLSSESNSKQLSLSPGQVSTRARDLLVVNLAQTDPDLREFCQQYPYNSQCNQASPNNSDPIPVPVAPPEPPTSNDNNNNSVGSSRQKSGWAIAPEVSTLGLGGHLVTRIIPQINARVGVNAFGLGLDIEETEAEYEGDLNLFNVSTILDLHPSKNSGFKLSGGLVFSNNNTEGTATTDETIEIGGQEFSIDQLGSVDADVDITSHVAPYVGLGWGNPVSGNKGLGFWLNAGVLFGGSPEVDLSPNLGQNVSPEIEAEINEAIEAEEAELEDDIGFFRVYPVVSLGFSYQF